MIRLLRAALVALCIGGLGTGLAHAAAPTKPASVTWGRCTLHLDYATGTRVVKETCHRYAIRHPKGRVVGQNYHTVRLSPHVEILTRYPRYFVPAPTLPACYWPAVRRYSAYIEAAAGRTGLPAGVIAAVIETESSGNLWAVSQGGDGLDVGLMQYGPTAAALVGGVYTYDPRLNILTGSLFLAYLDSRYAGGDLPLAVAMYNGGPANPQWSYEQRVYSYVCG